MITSICNKCGSSFEYTTNICVNPSYGSVFDIQNWSLSVCDECLKEFAESCVCKPKGYMEDLYEAYGKALNEIYG